MSEDTIDNHENTVHWVQESIQKKEKELGNVTSRYNNLYSNYQTLQQVTSRLENEKATLETNITHKRNENASLENQVDEKRTMYFNLVNMNNEKTTNK